MGEGMAKCWRCGGPMVATGEIGIPDGDWQCPTCDALLSCPSCLELREEVKVGAQLVATVGDKNRELEEEVRRWKEVNPNAVNIRYVLLLEKSNKHYESRLALADKVVEAADRLRKLIGDAHPGLMSWCTAYTMAYDDVCAAVRTYKGEEIKNG